MQKIKNIEFLRIIGCASVILFHFFNGRNINAVFFDMPLYAKMHIITQNGCKAVDLFFILSGLFFALKLNTNQSLFEFLKKKLIRLYPVLIFLIGISAILSLFGALKWSLYDNVVLLLGLNGTGLAYGIGSSTHLSQFWYVSSMLWVLLLYLYLLKNYSKKSVNLFIALIAFFSYSFLIHAKAGKINNVNETFYYIFNVGLLRAFGGIGTGYLIGEWWRENEQTVKQISFNIFQTFLTTALEFVCLYFIINNLMFYQFKYRNDIIFIIAFALITILFLAKKGYISKILNDTILGNIGVYFAKYTYSIYMVHILVYHTLKRNFWKHNSEFVFQYPELNIVLTITLAVVSGVLLYHFVEKPCMSYFKKRNNKTKNLKEKERE